MKRRRSGFTMVELLVVISIIMILATLTLAIFSTGRSSDKMRSAARITQSAFLGAKDRALHAKDLRGVRLTRDQTNTNLVNGMMFLQPLPIQSYGNGAIQLERVDLVDTGGNTPADGLADSAPVVIVHGFDSSSPAVIPPATVPVDWATKSQFFSGATRIRIPSGTGQWYGFTYDTTGTYALGTGNEYLRLSSDFGQSGVPFNAVIAFDRTNVATSSCDINLGNDLLPFHQPMTLPSSCVIDLRFSSPNVQFLASYSNIDIMFSSRGAVSGYLAGLGPMHFLIRDLKDATRAGTNYTYTDSASNVIPCGGWIVGPDVRTGAANQWGTTNPNENDSLILTVFPQTGLVQTFEVDPTDLITNGSSPVVNTPDGIADNPFNFAQQGKSAGR